MLIYLAPPGLSFFVSGGASASFCTAANRNFLCRRCFPSVPHRPERHFSFQAVLLQVFAPPQTAIFSTGGVFFPFRTARSDIFRFWRCFCKFSHRRKPQFSLQAVHALRAPVLFLFSPRNRLTSFLFSTLLS